MRLEGFFGPKGLRTLLSHAPPPSISALHLSATVRGKPWTSLLRCPPVPTPARINWWFTAETTAVAVSLRVGGRSGGMANASTVRFRDHAHVRGQAAGRRISADSPYSEQWGWDKNPWWEENKKILLTICWIVHRSFVKSGPIYLSGGLCFYIERHYWYSSDSATLFTPQGCSSADVSSAALLTIQHSH